jgi:hypothetical protein
VGENRKRKEQMKTRKKNWRREGRQGKTRILLQIKYGERR